MKWEDYAIEFKWDGGLRDIYVLETSLADWQMLLDFLYSSQYKFKYKSAKLEILPSKIGELFLQKYEEKGFLSIVVEEATLNCHFFDFEEIEFDIDPREVTSEEKADAIFDFMRQLGRSLNKEVILTSENHREKPIFKFSPATQELEYFPVMLDMMGPLPWWPYSE